MGWSGWKGRKVKEKSILRHKSVSSTKLPPMNETQRSSQENVRKIVTIISKIVKLKD